jgi:hypothetical protein
VEAVSVTSLYRSAQAEKVETKDEVCKQVMSQTFKLQMIASTNKEQDFIR